MYRLNYNNMKYKNLLALLTCFLLCGCAAECKAQWQGKAAKAVLKILKSTKGKVGVGAAAGAATIKLLEEDESPQNQIEERVCPVCKGGCGYFDFYGYYHPCSQCQGKGVIFVEKTRATKKQVTFTGTQNKYSNRETCRAKHCGCRIRKSWLDENGYNYCPECKNPTNWHYN